ncbi:hypothetical protein GTW20_13965 [Nocardiopsis alba]|uniref:Uncharacterized protein n=2 Tax=Nocardiopsis alba TaxID=53437 RepID=A0A7K2ITP5_9ACTN|nr:hypothetical protein [Nocardiopsis alba]
MNMPPQNAQAAFLNLLASTYARYGVEIEALPPTGMRIPIPGHDPLAIDYADTVSEVLGHPPELHSEFAEQIVFGMLRQLRSRGVPVGTHYPPLSTDLGRNALLSAFSERGIGAHFDFPDSLVVTMSDGTGIRQNVQDLLASLEGADEGTASKAAADFVASFEERARQVTSRQAPPRESLRSRLYPETAFPEGVMERLLTRPFAAGVVETVVADSPESMRPLNRGELSDLGLTEEQAFAQAVEGSLSEPVEVSRMNAGDVPIVHIGSEGGFYVNARLHELARHLGETEHGALVVFPSPPVVMAHVLGTAHPIQAMETLQGITERFVADTDKPVTDKLFWWRPGTTENGLPRLSEVRVEVDHETRSVSLHTADQEFGPLLQSLM